MENKPEQKEDKDKFQRNVALLMIGALLAYIVIGFVFWWLLNLYVSPERTSQKKDLIQALGFVMTGLAATFAGLAAIIGVYVTWRNLRETQTQTEENLKLIEQGQITERFTRAIEQLGATHEKGSKPKLEIRLGGIYALERIAKDSPKRDYSTIMEVLQAYVRERAPWIPEESTSLNSESKEQLHLENESIKQGGEPKPPLDIKSIMDVLKRLREAPELQEYLSPPDLRGANLEGAHITNINLEEARLHKSNLKGARLSESNLRGADLEEADLEEADLKRANLGLVYTWAANLQGANLQKANFQEANLSGAQRRGGELVIDVLAGPFTLYRPGANLHKADLRGANLSRADLRKAILSGADLRGANLNGTDLREAIDLTKKQLAETWGDKYTTQLPEDLSPPPHWEDLSAPPHGLD